MTYPLIDVFHLSVQIGSKYILKDINWQLFPKKHTVIYGQNGCGKTTLLSTILNYYPYTKGTINIFGQPLLNQSIFTLRKNIGWVSNSFLDKIFSQESVLDIVLSGVTGTLSTTFSFPTNTIKRAKRLLSFLNIGDYADYPYNLLSKGQQQQVLIARALLGQPKILFLDEPASNLDIINRENLFSIISDIADSTDTTIVYVTHYIEEILPIFSQCLLMKSGSIFKSGSLDCILNSQTITEFFNKPATLEKTSNRYNLSFQ